MNITAKIIAKSLGLDGTTITTFELEYPRFIHSEFMTHRLFSRNAASSRAVPVAKAIRLVLENTAMPIHWGKNQPGMTAKEECTDEVRAEVSTDWYTLISREDAWRLARDNSISVAESFSEAGYHKQIVNRLLETFSMIKVVVTATEWDNFFYLRDHPDAQPEIRELARVMLEEYNATPPVELNAGDWHVPYYKNGFWRDSGYVKTGSLEASDSKIGGNTLKEALAISSSCCAQVSYRVLDDSLEKAEDIFKRLVESKPVHASPFEHQATPIIETGYHNAEWGSREFLNDFSPRTWTKGITHMDRECNLWSGNFKSWIQHRQLIDDNVCTKYDGITG